MTSRVFLPSMRFATKTLLAKCFCSGHGQIIEPTHKKFVKLYK